MTLRKSKPCHVCGREMQWRKKWEKNWDEVKYCSGRCRSQRSKLSQYSELENRILELLRSRARGAMIEPADILEGEAKQDSKLIERVREAARRLAEQGELEIVQNGRPVKSGSFRGFIYLRIRQPR